jgi:predicted enzyme related to lactoylglutathione lyase
MSGFSEGAPAWADAALPDLAAGQRFYGELFGWTFQDQGEQFGHYTMALRDGKNAAALMATMDPSMPTAWNVHLAATDAERTAERIREAGGQIVFGPDAVGDVGVMLAGTDPGGSFFGVWQPGSHAGFGVVNEHGAFCWTENVTRDAAAVDAFYKAVFGYEAHQVDPGGQFDYAVYSLPNVADPVAGRMKRPAGDPADAPSRYQVYFAVDDCDAAASTVRRLGGRVDREPMDSPFGRMATVADDQGAEFAIIDLTRKSGDQPGL